MKAIVVVLALALAGIAEAPSYREEIEKYRADRLAELTAPDGWLAVAGLFWLHEGTNQAGSDSAAEVTLPRRAPRRLGTFTLASAKVTFTAAPDAIVTAGDSRITTFAFDPKASEEAGITTTGITLRIIRRGDRVGVRTLDPDSDARKRFRGLHYFPLDPAYHLRARFVPYDQPKRLPIPNVLGMTVQMESPGYVELVLRGRRYRLEPVYETGKHEDLFFIFRDPTSEKLTYEAGRFLHTPLPSGGFVDLDFNRAYNPPCAFTAFATCPLPPRQNRLPVAIRAGELRYEPTPSTAE